MKIIQFNPVALKSNQANLLFIHLIIQVGYV